MSVGCDELEDGLLAGLKCTGFGPDLPQSVTCTDIYQTPGSLCLCVISDQPGGEARGADPGAGVSSEAAGKLAAETQHAAAQQRHAVPAAARWPGHTQ